ncbi:MAG TPA: carbohydrate ABC transporter permease [Lachnospiraceae bacterium]|nr:carbohydrate ABC transporter permease [Lachnospiraceae bacterium]
MAAGTGKKEMVSAARQTKHGTAMTVFFAILAFLWISPILIVVLNSFKRKAYIFKNPFGISNVSLSRGFDRWAEGIKKTFVGMTNYANAIKKTDFFRCFGYSLFITVVSVALIVICCSMCAWYIVRVKNVATKTIYLLCLFSMIVPFQMVMFTLSKFANILHLSNPAGICIVYLGFGAGLAVFMFTGFVKQIPLEIEEAAMIDGCSPVQTYFKVVLPIMKPTIITVAILDAMWIWNDYLLPSLVLNVNKYKTIQIAVQFLKQSHGQIDWGAMMAVLVLAILPIVIFYIFVQRYIIEGVVAGAVKG